MFYPEKGLFSIGIVDGLRWSSADRSSGARDWAFNTPNGISLGATAKVEEQSVALTAAIELGFNSKSGFELTVTPYRVWILGGYCTDPKYF